MDGILAAPVLLGAAGGLFALFLAVADIFLAVKEDPQEAMVASALPGLNCGACGFASCAAYAKAVVSGDAEIGKCSSADEESIKFLKTIFSSSGSSEKKTAVVRCAGGSVLKFAYKGVASCQAAELLGGGHLECFYGCLGLGDCETVCPFGAIKVGPEGTAKVDYAKCTGCGLCVKACPKGIIELLPVSRKYYVACSSPDKTEVRAYCKNGCFACGICAGKKFNPDGVLIMKDNLPVVLEDKLKDSSQLLTAGSKCPVKAWKEISSCK
ncbi:4Fe-4S binding protein [bacterium]|nr:4Fe-4S binding protein [bacterium]MBU4134108.1 4Fe-4S binding protein [bacterium]